MPALFDYELTVASSEIDGLGHVNNLAYLKWMQDAAIAHSTAQGWPTDRYFELGAGWVVRSHQIEYLRPAFVAEHLLVRTWVADFRRISSLRKYKIVRRDDRLVLAVAQTQWAFIGFQDHVPRRIPADVCSSFELLPADEEP